MDIKLDDIFGFKVYKVFSLLKSQIFHQFYQNNMALNFEQWIILNRLWDNDGVTQSDLLDLTMQSKGNLARTLKKMESEKLIKKKSNPVDLRSCTIHLTESARKLKPLLRSLAFDRLSKSLEGISKKDLETASKVLMKMETNLKGD